MKRIYVYIFFVITLIFSDLSVINELKAGQLQNQEGNSSLQKYYSYYRTGMNYFNKRDYESALKYLKSVASKFMQELGNHKNTAFVLHDLANTYRLLGMYKLSRKNFVKSLKMKLGLFGKNNKSTVRTMYFLGVVLTDMGEYTKAIYFVKRVLNLRLKLYGRYDIIISDTFNYLSWIYFLLKDFSRSVLFMKRSYNTLFKKFGENHKYMAHANNNMGAVYTESGDLNKALYYHKKAFNLFSKYYGANHLQTAYSYHNLGVVLSKMKEYEKSVNFFQKAISIRRKILSKNHTLIAGTYVYLAVAYREQGLYQKAMNHLKIAYNIYIDKFGEEHPMSAEVFSNLGYIFYYLQEYEKASEILIKSENIFNKLRFKMLDERERESFRKGYAKLYSKIVSSLYMLKNYEKAFIYAEKAKARGMLEFLHNANVMNNYNFSPKGKKINALLKSAKTRYNALHIRFLEEIKKPESKRNKGLLIRLAKKKFYLNDKIKILNFKLTRAESALKKLLKPDILNHKQASKLIDNNTAIIQYFLTGEDTFAFIIFRNKLKMLRLGDNERVNYLLNLYAKYIKRPQYHNPHKFLVRVRKLKSASRGLYALLLKEVLKNIPKGTHLIVIPSGKTGFIPFEGLINENSRPVIEKYNVSYTPSISVYNNIPKIMRRVAYPLLAFGGAVYNAKENGVSTSRSENSNNISRLKNIFKLSGKSPYAAGNALRTRGGWMNLPGTRDEISNLSLLFYGNRKNLHIFAGVDVSEDRVKYLNVSKALQKYKIIHFAAHGYLNLSIPEMSSVVLTQPDGKIKKIIQTQFNKVKIDDGFLTMPEIVNLKLKSELVTLSACETGLGKIESGEGVINLARSFLFAGTRKVIVTLWKVNDLASSVFMSEFYKYYLRYNNVYKALFQVKKDFASGKSYNTKKGNRKFADPLYWAPFVIYGR